MEPEAQQISYGTGSSETKQLRDSASKQYRKNAELYQRLRASDVFLDFPLYAPPLSGRHPSMDLDRAQLLSIIDRLLAQEERLNQLERKHKFREQSSTQQDLRNIVERSYGFLRKAWAQEPTYEQDTQEKLDRVNKIVGGIRGNLLKLLNSHRKKAKVEPMEEVVMQSRSYTQLKEAYERLMMQHEDNCHLKNQQLLKMEERVKQKDRENELLRVEIKEQKDRIRRLENQSIAAELRLQEITGKLNSLKFEQQRQDRRTKLICKGAEFELMVRQLRPSEQPKINIHTARRPEEILEFLQNASPIGSPLKSTEALQETTNNTNEPEMRFLSPNNFPIKRTSIRPIPQQNREQLISQVRFSRTHSLLNISRKTSDGTAPNTFDTKTGDRGNESTK